MGPVLAAGPAAADLVATDSDELIVQVVVPERTAPGALVMSIAFHGEAVQFDDAHRMGDRLTFDADLPEVNVTDTRNVTQTAGGGWALSGRSSAFSSDDAELGADHLGWTPRVGPAREGLFAGSPVVGTLQGGPGLAVPATLASANASGRLERAQVNADLSLEIPVGTPAGSYRAALSISLFPTD